MHEWTEKTIANWKLIIVLSVEKVVILRKSSVQSHWESTARVFYIENVGNNTGHTEKVQTTITATNYNNHNNNNNANGSGFHDLHDLSMILFSK